MHELTVILAVSWAAGLAALAGGLAARYERISDGELKDQVVHGVVGFGGGILLSAVTFALLPEGMEVLDGFTLAVVFCSGGVGFAALGALLRRQGGSASQFVALVIDFVPEALSLCAVFGRSRELGILLAAFIGAQNLPEGFNAYRELQTIGVRPRSALWALAGASVLGPVAALIGHLFLRGQQGLTASIMVFAAGGILYLIFDDIAPQAKSKRHGGPALGAVLGFALGMLGKTLLG